MNNITDTELEHEYKKLEKLLSPKIVKIRTENNIPENDIRQTIKMALIEAMSLFTDTKNVKKHNYLLKYIDWKLSVLTKEEGKYSSLKRHGNEMFVKIQSLLENNEEIKKIPVYEDKILLISKKINIGAKTVKKFINPPIDAFVTNYSTENNIEKVFDKINYKQIEKIIITKLGSREGKIFLHAICNGIDNKIIAKMYKVPIHRIEYSIRKSKKQLKNSFLIKQILGKKD
jgi:hypothetical protein